MHILACPSSVSNRTASMSVCCEQYCYITNQIGVVFRVKIEKIELHEWSDRSFSQNLVTNAKRLNAYWQEHELSPFLHRLWDWCKIAIIIQLFHVPATCLKPKSSPFSWENSTWINISFPGGYILFKLYYQLFLCFNLLVFFPCLKLC